MAELTEEDLKNMTPEQIAEIQKQNCIFCHIVSGRVSSKKIYEDDMCIAVLDINPANPGHVLLLPRHHYAVMPQIPEEIIGHMFMVAKGISHACLRSFKAEGTNIFAANGVAAGQRAQHFMIHVIPRKEGDGLEVFRIPHKEMASDQLNQVRAVLKKRVGELLGVQGVQPLVVGKQFSDGKNKENIQREAKKEFQEEKQLLQEPQAEDSQAEKKQAQEPKIKKLHAEEKNSQEEMKQPSAQLKPSKSKESKINSLDEEERRLKKILSGVMDDEESSVQDNKNQKRRDQDKGSSDESDDDSGSSGDNPESSDDSEDRDDSDDGNVDLDKIANLFG